VLSGLAPEARAKQAMDSASRLLIDDAHSLIQLFTPPFENTSQEPGYIKGYPPGVRENGGQYTHAATWFVLALTKLRRGDEAYRAFSLLNPVNHALTREAADIYRVEPYVVAADVYSQGDKAGRGGWTWYTGSAGWLYRAAVEGVLGLSRRAEVLTIEPCLPSGWPGFEATMRIGSAAYAIRVERGDHAGITLNGEAVDAIMLSESGEHHVVVTVPHV
jgi:cyclic beta-1,2-glucan synthetase